MELIGAIIAIGYLGVALFLAGSVLIDAVQDGADWFCIVLFAMFCGIPWVVGWLQLANYAMNEVLEMIK